MNKIVCISVGEICKIDLIKFLHEIFGIENVVSYCFLRVGTVGAVICVRTINSVNVFVYCNDAYSCAIPRAIVEVVCKYFKCLRVVIA